jgi:hypothetical protein
MACGAKAYVTLGHQQLEAQWQDNLSSWTVNSVSSGSVTSGSVTSVAIPQLQLLSVDFPIVKLHQAAYDDDGSRLHDMTPPAQHHMVTVQLQSDSFAPGSSLVQFHSSDATSAPPELPQPDAGSGDVSKQPVVIHCVARGCWGSCVPVKVVQAQGLYRGAAGFGKGYTQPPSLINLKVGPCVALACRSCEFQAHCDIWGVYRMYCHDKRMHAQAAGLMQSPGQLTSDTQCVGTLKASHTCCVIPAQLDVDLSAAPAGGGLVELELWQGRHRLLAAPLVLLPSTMGLNKAGCTATWSTSEELSLDDVEEELRQIVSGASAARGQVGAGGTKGVDPLDVNLSCGDGGIEGVTEMLTDLGQVLFTVSCIQQSQQAPLPSTACKQKPASVAASPSAAAAAEGIAGACRRVDPTPTWGGVVTALARQHASDPAMLANMLVLANGLSQYTQDAGLIATAALMSHCTEVIEHQRQRQSLVENLQGSTAAEAQAGGTQRDVLVAGKVARDGMSPSRHCPASAPRAAGPDNNSSTPAQQLHSRGEGNTLVRLRSSGPIQLLGQVNAAAVDLHGRNTGGLGAGIPAVATLGDLDCHASRLRNRLHLVSPPGSARGIREQQVSGAGIVSAYCDACPVPALSVGAPVPATPLVLPGRAWVVLSPSKPESAVPTPESDVVKTSPALQQLLLQLQHQPSPQAASTAASPKSAPPASLVAPKHPAPTTATKATPQGAAVLPQPSIACAIKSVVAGFRPDYLQQQYSQWVAVCGQWLVMAHSLVVLVWVAASLRRHIREGGWLAICPGGCVGFDPQRQEKQQ